MSVHLCGIEHIHRHYRSRPRSHRDAAHQRLRWKCARYTAVRTQRVIAVQCSGWIAPLTILILAVLCSFEVSHVCVVSFNSSPRYHWCMRRPITKHLLTQAMRLLNANTRGAEAALAKTRARNHLISVASPKATTSGLLAGLHRPPSSDKQGSPPLKSQPSCHILYRLCLVRHTCNHQSSGKHEIMIPVPHCVCACVCSAADVSLKIFLLIGPPSFLPLTTWKRGAAMTKAMATMTLLCRLSVFGRTLLKGRTVKRSKLPWMCCCRSPVVVRKSFIKCLNLLLITSLPCCCSINSFIHSFTVIIFLRR